MPFEPLDQYLQRKKKLAEIAALGEESYPHRFDQTATAAELVATHGSQDAQRLRTRDRRGSIIRLLRNWLPPGRQLVFS